MKTLPLHRSLLLDRIILFLLVPAIYFEANLPHVGEASTSFVFFGFILFYALTTRPNAMVRLLSTKYFIAAIFFTVVCLIMESSHYDANYEFIFRFLAMIVGIFCVAGICADKKAMDITLFSFMLISAVQSVLLILFSFSELRTSNVEGFYDASKVRINVFQDFILRSDLNDISYLCNIGAIFGIIYFYYETDVRKKTVLFALTVISIFGVFLPASRLGMILFFISISIFFFKSRFGIKRLVFYSLLLFVFLMLAVPDVVWTRLASLVNISELQGTDSRTGLYAALFRSIDQYFLSGVGAVEYWQGWAVQNGFTSIAQTQVAVVVHNAFFQILVFWGLPALLAFFYLIYVFSKAIDSKVRNNKRKTAIFIFTLMIPVYMMFQPTYFQKTFSICLGILLASRFWNYFYDERPAQSAHAEK